MPKQTSSTRRKQVSGNLSQLAKKIVRELKALATATRSALLHARVAGETLMQAKSLCDREHIKWGSWCRDHCGTEERTANNYIRIARKWATIQARMDKTGEPMTVREALNLIREPKDRAAKSGEEPAAVPQLKPRQTAALMSVLEEHRIQGEPAAVLTALVGVGANLKKVLSNLDAMGRQMEADEFNEWINSHLDMHDQWEAACQPYGVESWITAEAAYRATDDVYAYHEEHPKDQRPAPQWDGLLDGVAGWYYFAQTGTFNAAAVAGKAANWLAKYGCGEELLDDEEVEELRERLAAGPQIEPAPLAGEAGSPPGDVAPPDAGDES